MPELDGPPPMRERQQSLEGGPLALIPSYHASQPPSGPSHPPPHPSSHSSHSSHPAQHAQHPSHAHGHAHAHPSHASSHSNHVPSGNANSNMIMNGGGSSGSLMNNDMNNPQSMLSFFLPSSLSISAKTICDIWPVMLALLLHFTSLFHPLLSTPTHTTFQI